MRKSDNAGEARKHLGHGIADTFSKSYTLSAFTRDPEIINKYAYSMLKSFNFSYLDMRGFGIQMTRLDNAKESTISRKFKKKKGYICSSLLIFTI